MRHLVLHGVVYDWMCVCVNARVCACMRHVYVMQKHGLFLIVRKRVKVNAVSGSKKYVRLSQYCSLNPPPPPEKVTEHAYLMKS
jgi:hypothetical protein